MVETDLRIFERASGGEAACDRALSGRVPWEMPFFAVPGPRIAVSPR